MSTLLEQASLVMIPSGYKEDVVYSQIPTSGAGDLSFTRASNGTRVNSAGLVEVVAWNLILQSETFENSYWSKQNGTITTNAITAPNGTTTADLFTITNNSGGVEKTIVSSGTLFTFIPNTQYTFSCYFKKGSIDYNFRMLMYDGSTVTNSGIINLTTPSSSTVSYEDVGNGWYRFYHTFTSSASALSGYFYAVNYDYSTTITSGTNVYLWGAQVVQGSTAKPYFPTTDRLNVPRLTYQNGGGGCPSLLLEKQSTNLITYSEQIQNAAWNVIGGDLVVTGNAVISPDGTQNAGAITLANSANRYFVHDPFSITGGVAYTYSVWMKSASGNLSINMGGVNGLAGVLKTVTTEWQRFTYTFTPASSYSEYFGFDNRGAGSSTSGTLYFWGAQVEASSYPTSYIPTTSSSATRVADACFKTGISSLIGTDFTIFFDGYQSIGGNSSRYLVLKGSGGTYANSIFFESNSSKQIACSVLNSSGNLVFGPLTSALTSGQRLKFALRCKNNDFAFYMNGVSQGTQASGTVPTTADLYLGYYVDYQDNYNVVNQLAIFNQTLTNAELASLTTI